LPETEKVHLLSTDVRKNTGFTAPILAFSKTAQSQGWKAKVLTRTRTRNNTTIKYTHMQTNTDYRHK